MKVYDIKIDYSYLRPGDFKFKVTMLSDKAKFHFGNTGDGFIDRKSVNGLIAQAKSYGLKVERIGF